MTTGMLQEPLQTASPGVGPRFRPYASPNHHVTKGRYITSNDPRGYIPVYEYPLNGQWIMMDIDDGYILWTGIWKALGNSKADIVKMIDSQPDLAPLIRRVRGGYLKIQGTWMPYEVALKLSRRVAWTIRDDLIPLFGPTFPSTCLSPDQPGYGQVVASGNGRRRARRNTQATATVQGVRDTHTNWTVVTPTAGSSTAHHDASRHPYAFAAPRSAPDFIHPPSYSPIHHHHHHYPHSPSSAMMSPGSSKLSPIQSHMDTPHRYSPYSAHASISHKPATKGALSLDIPSTRLQGSSRSRNEQIMLPPIRPTSSDRTSDSPYALPPISAMEDLRGIDTHDSAAVLRRLKLDDDYPKSEHRTEERGWSRRHSVTVQSYAGGGDASRYQPYHHSPSCSPSVNDYGRLAPSDADSNGGTSPISPATPQSAVSSRDSHHSHAPLSISSDRKHLTGLYSCEKSHHRQSSQDWAPGHRIRVDGIRDSMSALSAPDSDNDSSSHPHRPW
ncbi:hypothetical protein BDQ12DRAFT_362935 [Crucibulum laeve]|uniref:HTH APSES-type domain-containing protein n=1 Tax=Crucibulum laeve TaxID=68775 RepID=A0A5C3LMX4_9AGAR|nr:hypothetical protein BDQ12DRAFT_362935 [Crucibulum laeve]